MFLLAYHLSDLEWWYIDWTWLNTKSRDYRLLTDETQILNVSNV